VKALKSAAPAQYNINRKCVSCACQRETRWLCMSS
jgi:hypothetical protein